MGSELEKLFKAVFVMTVGEMITSSLRKYVKENPEKKAEVINSLKLFIAELENKRITNQ
jgi:hypothetical protein